MVVIVAASSLHKALADDREGLQTLIEVLKQYVHSDFGVNLHPDSSNQRKTVQKILHDYPDEPAIIWHDVIKNGITEHPTDPREPLTADELLHEIGARPASDRWNSILQTRRSGRHTVGSEEPQHSCCQRPNCYNFTSQTEES